MNLPCNAVAALTQRTLGDPSPARRPRSRHTSVKDLGEKKERKCLFLSRPLGFKASFKERTEAGWGDPTDMRKCNLHIREGASKGKHSNWWIKLSYGLHGQLKRALFETQAESINKSKAFRKSFTQKIHTAVGNLCYTLNVYKWWPCDVLWHVLFSVLYYCLINQDE